MIKINWTAFCNEYVIFGFYYRWVWVTDGSVNEMQWIYSNRWKDRLYPFRQWQTPYPAWWDKIFDD